MIDCIFCKIVAGSIPATIVAESERSIAFKDINPRHNVHMLVIPKDHHTDVAELAINDPEAMADLMQLGAKVASEQTAGHFRFTFKTGKLAGQVVFHAHGHITSTEPVSA